MAVERYGGIWAEHPLGVILLAAVAMALFIWAHRRVAEQAIGVEAEATNAQMIEDLLAAFRRASVTSVRTHAAGRSRARRQTVGYAFQSTGSRTRIIATKRQAIASGETATRPTTLRTADSTAARLNLTLERLAA